MYCPYCGTENNDNAIYCRSCGSLLQEETNDDYLQTNRDYQSNINSDNYFDSYNVNDSNDTYGGYVENYNNYDLNNNRNYNNYPSKPPKKKSKAKLIVIIVIIVVLLLSLAASLYFFVFKDIINSNSNSDTSASSVSETDSSVTTTVEDTTTTISSTEPSTSTTKLSSVVIPNLVGLDEEKAKSILQKYNLSYNVEEDYTNHKKDVVYYQSPSAGDEVSGNVRVTIFVSKSNDATTTTDYDDPDTYILENSDYEYINESDLDALPEKYINLALNEIYARYGRKFNNKSIQDYFDNKNWYTASIEADDFEDSIFNEYETKNVATIVDYMKKKGLR